jgi:hypothetical protein
MLDVTVCAQKIGTDGIRGDDVRRVPTPAQSGNRGKSEQTNGAAPIDPVAFQAVTSAPTNSVAMHVTLYGPRLAKEISLHFGAALLLKLIKLIPSLDPFGGRGDGKAGPQARHGSHDAKGVRLFLRSESSRSLRDHIRRTIFH